MHTHAGVAPPSFSGAAVLEPYWQRDAAERCAKQAQTIHHMITHILAINHISRLRQ